MIEGNVVINEREQEKRKRIIGMIRKQIFEAESDNLRLKNPKKDSEMEEMILRLIKRNAEELKR